MESRKGAIARGVYGLVTSDSGSMSDNKYVSGSVRFAHSPYMALTLLWCGSCVRSVCSGRLRGRFCGGPRRKHLNVMCKRGNG